MPNKVAVVTDSTAHIPKELTVNLPIITVPVHLTWGGKSYRDDVDITPSEFYQRLKVDKETPKTSMASPDEFHRIYADLIGQGYDILSIHVTGKYTRVVDSAQLAADQFAPNKVEVMDSESSAMAMGFHVLEAARAAAAGEPLRHCKQAAESARDRTRVFFIPATLEFLRRGGRISNMTALIGSILQFKPILTVRDGSLVVLSRVRTMRHALTRLVEIVTRQIQSNEAVHFAFLHSNFPARAQDLMEKTLASMNGNLIKETLITDISPALGTHIGPEAVGLAYMLQE